MGGKGALNYLPIVPKASHTQKRSDAQKAFIVSSHLQKSYITYASVVVVGSN